VARCTALIPPRPRDFASAASPHGDPVQPGQQIRQTSLHRSEILVILDGRNAHDFMD
jgi:hypothetical protein